MSPALINAIARAENGFASLLGDINAVTERAQKELEAAQDACDEAWEAAEADPGNAALQKAAEAAAAARDAAAEVADMVGEMNWLVLAENLRTLRQRVRR